MSRTLETLLHRDLSVATPATSLPELLKTYSSEHPPVEAHRKNIAAHCRAVLDNASTLDALRERLIVIHSMFVHHPDFQGMTLGQIDGYRFGIQNSCIRVMAKIGRQGHSIAEDEALADIQEYRESFERIFGREFTSLPSNFPDTSSAQQ